MVSQVKRAVPAYLSRLAGRAPANAPRLQPPRTLFASVAGALTYAELEAPIAAFSDHTGPARPGPGAAQPSRVSGATSQKVQEPAAPGFPAGPHPLDAPPLPPLFAAAAAPGLTLAAPGTASPELLPIATGPTATGPAQPAGPAQPDMGASPALMPGGSAGAAAISMSTKSLSNSAAALAPPRKPAPSAPEMSGYPGFGGLGRAATPTQVSIGTIEVTVVPPPRAPTPPPPPHRQAHPKEVRIPGLAGADAAGQAARGAARRWFGVGQS